MKTDSVTFTAQEWRVFQAQFGELKHCVNNALAVFLALGELAKRNPANYAKLTVAVDLRTPEIVALFQQLTEIVEAKQPVAAE